MLQATLRILIKNLLEIMNKTNEIPRCRQRGILKRIEHSKGLGLVCLLPASGWLACWQIKRAVPPQAFSSLDYKGFLNFKMLEIILYQPVITLSN